MSAALFTNLNPPVGPTWPAFLLQLYPWIFGTGSVAFLKIRGFIPEVGPLRLCIGAVFSAVNLCLLCRGFGYESQIYQEMLVPVVIFFPYVREKVRSIPRLLLMLLPLTILVIFEQLKATQFDQWSYLIEGNRYLLWARPQGTVLEKLVYFGGQPYPLAELQFYVIYIAGTFTYMCAAVSLFGKSARPSQGLRWFFPAAYGLPAAVLVPLILWYVIVRRSLPIHAMSAGVSVTLFWIMYCRSTAARNFLASPLFAAITVFSFFQTGLFETYHVARGHWYYIAAKEIGGLAPWLHWTFPNLPLLGIEPRSWPIEEFCAYGGLWPFVYTMTLWLDEKLEMRVFK
jgi:hypothetical protein